MRDVDSFSIGGVLGAGISIYFRNFPLFPDPDCGRVCAVLFVRCVGAPGKRVAYRASGRQRREYSVRRSRTGRIDPWCGYQSAWKWRRKPVEHWQAITQCPSQDCAAVGCGRHSYRPGGAAPDRAGNNCRPHPVRGRAGVRHGRGKYRQSLQRSAALTKGYRGRLFAIFIALVIPMYVAAFVLVSTFGPLIDSLFTTILSTLVLQILLGGVYASCTAVAYHDLRILQEGVDTETIAAAFD